MISRVSLLSVKFNRFCCFIISQGISLITVLTRFCLVDLISFILTIDTIFPLNSLTLNRLRITLTIIAIKYLQRTLSIT